MIEANELRIGNCVNYNYQFMPKGWRPKPITHECIYHLACGGSNYKPIPLTEEMLLKCGFEKDTDGSFVKGFVSLFLDKRLRNNIFLKENNTKKWIGINCKIKHLHQLQNLYFALTGEELNIEL